MSEPLARLYDLALRTLDDQERRADAVRGRLGPTIAAAALGVTLLSGPVIGGAHPGSVGGKLALLLAVGVGNPAHAVWTRTGRARRVTDMARRDLRTTIREAMEFGNSMPRYDRRGRRMPTRAEWEQFSRWRRWRDLLLGWEPYKPRPLPWEQER